MQVMYKAATREKEFTFQDGDEIKIISTSFLYATENQPERVYTAKLVEIDDNGFWAVLNSVTVYPYSETARQPGHTEEIRSDSEEFFGFQEVEDVIGVDDDYPNWQDPLIRFALDGPGGVPRSSGRKPGRPSLGTTKKVSLTLTDEEWSVIEESDHPSVGSYLRDLIQRQQQLSSSWFAKDTEPVDNVVKNTGSGFWKKWEINFDLLSKITNGHPEFLKEVKEFWEKENVRNNIYNVAVYRRHPKDGREKISIVFDVIDNHIALFSCDTNYNDGHSYVLSASYNKSFVWDMATML